MIAKMGKRVARQECDLEEQHRGRPYSGRPAKDWQKHFGCHRLDQKQQSRTDERCEREEDALCAHEI